MQKYVDDSFSLHTDLYQINMAETYWNDGIHNRKAVFEVYFRSMPFKNGYAIYAGLERVIEYLREFKFTDSDIAYLRDEVGYEEKFLNYLKDVTFTGSVYSMVEGEVCFANNPILRVEAPLLEAQLIETALLNIINYQTLIATKASRIKHVVGNDLAMEFGTRRAQEMDAAIWGTRAAYIAGFGATSNVRAGKLFGIPVSGTHAHSLVQVYQDEYVAFHKYAEKHKDCTFLVDTYDTLRSGVPTAIKVAKELGDKINFKAIRLDSGDLAYLSKEARRMLDAAGFTETKIVASNDLDEHTIMNLKAQGAMIDAWGIGTKLITGYDQPALGAVYKLVAIESETGEMQDRIKISSNHEKVTTPGMKNIYRIIDRVTKKSEGDYITLATERPNSEDKIKMFHPIYTHVSKFVSNFDAIDLHQAIFVDGELVYELPTLEEIRETVIEKMKVLWEEYKRTLNPEKYPVDLSQVCWDNKMEIIKNVQQRVDKIVSEASRK